jgi:uncharacterized protein YneF (UPF0154 family)
MREIVGWALVIVAAVVAGAVLGIYLADRGMSCIAVRSVLVCHHVR